MPRRWKCVLCSAIPSTGTGMLTSKNWASQEMMGAMGAMGAMKPGQIGECREFYLPCPSVASTPRGLTKDHQRWLGALQVAKSFHGWKHDTVPRGSSSFKETGTKWISPQRSTMEHYWIGSGMLWYVVVPRTKLRGAALVPFPGPSISPERQGPERSECRSACHISDISCDRHIVTSHWRWMIDDPVVFIGDKMIQDESRHVKTWRDTLICLHAISPVDFTWRTWHSVSVRSVSVPQEVLRAKISEKQSASPLRT